jgi:hypothetical protein
VSLSDENAPQFELVVEQPAEQDPVVENEEDDRDGQEDR